jgi:hypothetical protein
MHIGKPRHREEELHLLPGAKGATTKPVDSGAFTLEVLTHTGNRARGAPAVATSCLATVRAGAEGRRTERGGGGELR